MKLTKIALALVAVLAMSALTASAASALSFNSSSSPQMLFGEQAGKHAFKVDGQAVECNSATFEKASQATPANEITGVTASYTGCTAFGFAGATINMHNCTYSFLTPNGTPAIMGKVSIACSNNATANIITIFSTVFGSECEVHVGSQGPLSTVSYANNVPAAGQISLTAEVTGIAADKTKDNGLCPLSGTGPTNNATYNGTTSIRGTTGNIAVA